LIVPTAPVTQLAGYGIPEIDLRDLVRIKRQMRALDLLDSRPHQPLPVLVCRPVLVDTASPDEKGCLVLANGRLVSVLVRVANIGVEQDREQMSGWQMEAGFGRCAVAVLPLFDTLGDALGWVRERLDAQ